MRQQCPMGAFRFPAENFSSKRLKILKKHHKIWRIRRNVVNLQRDDYITKQITKTFKTKKKMGRYIDPRADWAFKRIFGCDDTKECLITFLNGLFKGELKIKDVTFGKNELVKKQEGDRVSYLTFTA